MKKYQLKTFRNEKGDKILKSGDSVRQTFEKLGIKPHFYERRNHITTRTGAFNEMLPYLIEIPNFKEGVEDAISLQATMIIEDYEHKGECYMRTQKLIKALESILLYKEKFEND